MTSPFIYMFHWCGWGTLVPAQHTEKRKYNYKNRVESKDKSTECSCVRSSVHAYHRRRDEPARQTGGGLRNVLKPFKILKSQKLWPILNAATRLSAAPRQWTTLGRPSAGVELSIHSSWWRTVEYLNEEGLYKQLVLRRFRNRRP